jgi:hypothetical protein
MRRRKWTIGLVAFALLGCAVGGCSPKAPSSALKELDPRFDENKTLVATIKGANRLILYEGLPHQFFEKAQLAEEKQTKETVSLPGFPSIARRRN